MLHLLSIQDLIIFNWINIDMLRLDQFYLKFGEFPDFKLSNSEITGKGYSRS